MRLCFIFLLLVVSASVCFAWAAELAWFAAGQFSSGLSGIAANCHNNNPSACAVGALQLVFGAVVGIGAGTKAFGLWKRDETDRLVLHIYENKTYPTEELSSRVRRGDSEDFNILFHHIDGSTRSGRYHFNAKDRLHTLHGSFATNEDKGSAAKREVVGGNDGFGLAFNDEDADTWYNVAGSSGDTNEWATEAYNNMGDNEDAICAGFTDPDNNEHVALARVQPATDGDYTNLDLSACGNTYRRRWTEVLMRRSIVNPRSTKVTCPLTCLQEGDNVDRCEAEGGSCAPDSSGIRCSFTLGGAAATDCDGVQCTASRGPC